MTLLETIQATQGKIKGLSAMERGSREREATKTRHAQLIEVTRPLHEATSRLVWLQSSVQGSSNEVKRAIEGIVRMREMVASDTAISEVTKGQNWARMLNNVSAAASVLEKQAKEAWRAKLAELGSFDEPTAVSSNLAQTQANMAALDRYRQRFAFYREIARKPIPDRETDIQQVTQAAAGVEEAYRALDFAVPAAVKEFLQAANSVGGARLSLLSDEVRAWIVEQGLEAQYVVRSMAN